MSVFSTALYQRVLGQTDLTALLATYRGAPAVFLDNHVPGDAARPYLYSPPNIVDVPFEAKNSATWGGREFHRDWTLVFDRTASPALLETAAEMLRALFHRHRLVIAGYETLISRVTGPIVAPSDETLRALTLTTIFVVIPT